MRKAHASWAVLEHSDPTSDKHKKDKLAQDIHKAKMLNTGLMKSMYKENTDSNPLVPDNKVDKGINYDLAGYLVGEGITSTKLAIEKITALRNEIDALGKNKIRTGTLEKNCIARDRSKQSKSKKSIDKNQSQNKKIEGEKCIAKHTFTVDPVVSGYVHGLDARHQKKFIELLFPKIEAYAEQQFPEAKKLGFIIHADTAHLHFDIWMQKGKFEDFKGRVGKGFLYVPNSDATRGIGTGICHLSRKEKLYQLAGEQLLSADAQKLRSGRINIEKNKRDLDLVAQTSFDENVKQLIPAETYKKLAKKYAVADKERSPFKMLDTLDSIHAKLEKKEAELDKREPSIMAREKSAEELQTQYEKKIANLEKREKDLEVDEASLDKKENDLNEREIKISEFNFWKLWGRFGLKAVFKSGGLENLVKKTVALINQDKKIKIKSGKRSFSKNEEDQIKKIAENYAGTSKNLNPSSKK